MLPSRPLQTGSAIFSAEKQIARPAPPRLRTIPPPAIRADLA